MELSTFGAILADLERSCAGFLAAIFYDEEGETIDYHSRLGPFETRLEAAHLGVLVRSASHRARWTGLGSLEWFEIRTDRRESLTVPLGSGLVVSLLLEAGGLGPETLEHLLGAVARLRLEAGV
jgi:predicted regulator of Ras-like GTPase activity (Roadblock/LC7/MglB family)